MAKFSLDYVVTFNRVSDFLFIHKEWNSFSKSWHFIGKEKIIPPTDHLNGWQTKKGEVQSEKKNGSLIYDSD